VESIKPDNQTLYWIIGLTIGTVLNWFGLSYLIITRNNRNNKSMYQSKYYERETSQKDEPETEQ
jgi:hypothetical protein